MSGLQEYWRNLSSRERLLIGGAVILVLAAILYLFIWEPWHRKLEQLRSQVPAKIESLQWMRAQQIAYTPLLAQAQQARPRGGGPLLTLIEQSANQARIRQFVTRIQPGEDSQVQVWIEDAPFDPWLGWISALKNQGIEVDAASVSRAEANMVSIRVTLRRA